MACLYCPLGPYLEHSSGKKESRLSQTKEVGLCSQAASEGHLPRVEVGKSAEGLLRSMVQILLWPHPASELFLS